MRFMVIRKADPETEAGVMPGPELLAAMGSYNAEQIKDGAFVDGAGLKPTSQGTRVRRAGGKVTVTDGPFAEAKELVAGFSILKVKSKEEAIARLQKWPPLDGHGEVSLELRLLYEASDFGGPEDAPVPAAPARKPGTTRHILLLASNAVTEAGAPPDPAVMATMGDLMDTVAATGALLGGEGLKASAKGARIKFSRGKGAVTDGPFSETKELIAGYVVLQGSKDDAIAFAKQWLKIHVDGLGLDDGVIEIRPMYEMEDFGG